MSKEENKHIVSFTFDELTKDINYDRIFLFILSYEYDMNFNQVMALFNFSSDIFWTFINTLRPMLKLGDRKASMLKHSARKIYFKWLGSKVELSEKEEDYYNQLSVYLNDSFSNGDICLHASAIVDFPLTANGAFIKYRSGEKLQTITINSKEELFKYIDSIETIVIDGEVYSKTSRIEFLVEKYYGDLNYRVIKHKTIKELRDMLTKEAIDLHNQELRDRAEALIKHRMELVHRHG